MVKAIPDGAHTLTPYLICRDAAKAIDFYVKAFGAKEIDRMQGDDGKIMHSTLQIGNSQVYVAEECPEYGFVSPLEYKGSPVGLHLYFEDVDQAWNRATKAGAQIKMPLADMFWGDRYGKLTDPFGHEWSLATHKEDLTDAQIKERGEKFMKEFAGAKN